MDKEKYKMAFGKSEYTNNDHDNWTSYKTEKSNVQRGTSRNIMCKIVYII